MNIKEWKIELRRQAEKARNALSVSERAEKSAVINEILIRRLDELFQSFGARSGSHPPTLFTYMPIKSEVDVKPVMEACWSRKYRIVVSKVQPEAKQLKLFELRTHDDLEKGTWGILEPKPSAPQLTDIRQIDAVLVPGLAFDVHLGRLGYGGGYYDRFMQQYVRAGWSKPYILAGAFDIQMIKEVPMGLFDFRLDELITEERSIRAAKTRG